MLFTDPLLVETARNLTLTVSPPGSEWCYDECRGHFPWLEKPTDIMDQVIDFINGL